MSMNDNVEELQRLTKVRVEENTKNATDPAPVTLDIFEETEVAAEIFLPLDGGFGWVVVAASFSCLFILEGICYTFGSIFKDIADDLQAEVSLVALANSLTIGLFHLLGPLVSGFINRYGFRTSGMVGSVLISSGYFTSTFVKNYLTFLIFYGIIPGIGSCFVYMAATVIVGFYFERLRALASAIVSLGGSIGITMMYNVSSKIVNLAGWRTLTLMHSGLFGLIYFLSTAFRPLLALTMAKREDTQAVAYLPSLANLNRTPSSIQPAFSSPVERHFNTLSSIHFPSAADLLGEPEPEEPEDTEDTIDPGASSKPQQKITIRALEPQDGISPRQLKQYHSIMSRTNFKDKDRTVEISAPTKTAFRKRHWFSWCHVWEKRPKGSRPLYRDDVFYHGRLEDLPEYKEHVTETDAESRIGIEYHMAVTRAVAVSDIEDHKGICTTASKRVLATMLDPNLLKRKSFIMVCATGFIIYIGMLPMFVFLPDRNRHNGVPEVHCNFFVSTIGISNAIGKLLVGLLSCKFSPVKMFSIGYIMAGLSVIMSTFSYNAYYQHVCCVVFGASVACGTLRSPVLVKLFDLEKLTNATGIILMFQGCGILLSTPLSHMLTNIAGYTVAFYVSGTLILSGGIILTNVRRVAKKEKKAQARVSFGRHASISKWKKKGKDEKKTTKKEQYN